MSTRTKVAVLAGVLAAGGAGAAFAAKEVVATPSDALFTVYAGRHGTEVPVDVGSVIARGQQVDGGCVFAHPPSIRVEVSERLNIGPKVRWRVDGSCGVVITQIFLPAAGDTVTPSRCPDGGVCVRPTKAP
jgi:hypothetical protein